MVYSQANLLFLYSFYITKFMINFPSISTNMEMVSHLAKIANQPDAINLANDFSDFPCQSELLNALVWHLTEGRNKYAPPEGVIGLREVISEYYRFHFNYSFNPETEITITAGAIQAIYTAISAIINEGDEVIVFEPAFETYVPAIEARGARPIYFPLKHPDFSIDWDAFPKLINGKTKAIIINSPHNPTGKVLSPNDLAQLQRIVNGTKIFIVSDESFVELVYDGEKRSSICSIPKLAERSIVIGSLGKSLCVPGWKVGYCMAPESIMARFRLMHRYQVFSVNLPVQLALSDYLHGKTTWFPYGKEFQSRRDLLNSLLSDSKFTIYPAQGGYFQVLSYENVSKENDVDFSLRLAQDYSILALPMSFYYHDTFDSKQLRVCFGKSEEDLTKAVNILKSV